MGSQFFEDSFKGTGAMRERQSLVDIIDNLARTKPHAAYAFSPISPNDCGSGFRKVSYKQFANVVNGLAWWMTAQFGRSSSTETLAYIGPNDIRQNAIIAACSKSGYQVLLASPRNQQGALQSLLEQMDCKALLAADLASPATVAFQKARTMPTFQVPDLKILLKEDFPHFSKEKTFDESKDDGLVVLHTSGTTALPKPITYTNDWAASYIQTLRTPSPHIDTAWELKDLHLRGVRLLVMMPPFHAANIFCTSFLAVACETAIVLPPANLPPTVEAFMDVIRNIQVDTAFVPPHFVSQIAANRDYLDVTADRVNTLLSGGGRIIESHGDLVSSKVNLMTVYGATEVGSVPDLTPVGPRAKHLWNYLKPHPDASWQFRPYDGAKDEMVHEAWIVRGESPGDEPPVFKIYGDRYEYSTRDLFVPHPTIPNIWKWCGRIDDTVCLSTGANVSPANMENGLSQVPQIQGALMLGTGLRRPVLLIEPREKRETPESKNELIKEVWKAVEELNLQYFIDHRVLIDHVLITDVAKPMVRSLKGSIQRNATSELYEKEFKKLFD